MNLLRSALAGLLALSAVATASAQQFPTVPDRTVIGRIGIGGQSGPSQAIPFAVLFSNLVSASGVPNAVLKTDGSGNGSFSSTLPSALTIPSPNLTGSVSSPFGANLPLFGGGSGSPIVAGTTTGNTTKVATGSGSYTATNCIQSDANHNLVDSGAPCGTGSNLSYVQDFIGGTDFTAGTTTSLTVTNAPLTTQSTTVYFDGVRQSANTWSLTGSTVTFLAAIPTNTKVVEIASLSSTVLPTWVISIGGLTGAVSLGAGLTTSGQTLISNSGSVDNFLPNTQWQLWTNVSYITKQNAAGTGSQTAASCASFQISTSNPVLTCSATATIRANDLVYTNIAAFWGFAGAGYITCSQVQCSAARVTAARVLSVSANTSIGLSSPGFGGVSPAGSSATVVTPISPGELGGGGTAGADGWIKTGTLVATVDDWGTSATPASTVYPGCIRPLLLRKGITGTENYSFSVPVLNVPRYRGRTVTMGAAVYQRVQGGAGTWSLRIDDTSGSTSSATGTGASLGGYQFLTSTRTIAANATAVQFNFILPGNAGDVFDVCLPTAAFTPSMVESQLKQNTNEIIRANNHWNPPLLTPYIINFPSVELVGGSGLYGYNGIDLEAISFGTVHNSVGNVYAKLEWTGTNPGKNVFFGANMNTSNLTFGLQAATQVSGVQFPTPIARVPLYHDGTVAFYTDQSGLVPTTGTFDFTDVEATPPSSMN